MKPGLLLKEMIEGCLYYIHPFFLMLNYAKLEQILQIRSLPKYSVFPPYSLQEHRTTDAERAQQILSKLISSIIVHCPRPNYYNYLPGGAKSPRRILTRACPESTLQNLENFISARVPNTRLEVRVSLCVLLIFRFPTKEEEHRHSTIRATSLSVKFDAKTQDARKIPHPFAVLCARKKNGAVYVSRRSLIVID